MSRRWALILPLLVVATPTLAKDDQRIEATTKKPKTKKLFVIPAKKLKVWTMNGSAIDGQANEAAIALRSAGYPLATVGDLPGNSDLGVAGNAWNQNFFVTKIYYANLRAKGAARKLRHPGRWPRS